MFKRYRYATTVHSQILEEVLDSFCDWVNGCEACPFDKGEYLEAYHKAKIPSCFKVLLDYFPEEQLIDEMKAAGFDIKEEE